MLNLDDRHFRKRFYVDREIDRKWPDEVVDEEVGNRHDSITQCNGLARIADYKT